MWIAVTQIHNQTQRHLIVFQVVKVRSTEGAARTEVERPANGVNNFPWDVLLGRNIPYFLKANAVVLRVRVLIEIESLNKRLAQMTSTAFSKHSVFSMEFVAGCKRGFLLAVCANSHISGCDPLDRTIFMEKNFRGCKAWKYVDSERFCLLTQPSTKITQTGGIISVIVERARNEKRRQPHTLLFVDQHIDVIISDWIVEWRAHGLPVWEELIQRCRLDHGTGKDVCANLRAFLDETNGYL